MPNNQTAEDIYIGGDRLRRLGTTDFHLSAIGLGTVKFGRNTKVHYPNGFEIPNDQALLELMELAAELGINFLDTAPAYGHSEETLGRLLKRTQNDWIICTKAGEYFENDASYYDYSKQKTIASVENSLVTLGRDQLDIVLIHSDGNDESILEHTDIVETLVELKQAGKIGAIGMSPKTVAGSIKALGFSDLLMITLNRADTSQIPAIEAARALGIGVFIKKALASGHSTDPKQALNFASHFPGVTSAIVGTISPTHLQQNIASLSW